MKKNVIIAVLGGGGIYTPDLVNLLCDNSDIIGKIELRLMDISEERLNVVGGLCKRIIEKAKSDIDVSYHDNYEDSINNADYVLIQFRSGGGEARIKDEKLGKKYKIPFVETVTVCGFATFLRSYYDIEKVADVILKLAPNAWVMNFSNPAGMLTEALYKLGVKKVVGVCNASVKFLDYAYNKLGTKDLFINWRGLNHFTFTDVINVNGKNVITEFIDSLEDYEDASIPFPKALIKSLGFLPNQYLQYYFLKSEIVEKQQNQEKVRSEVVKETDNNLLALYKDIDYVPDELKKRGGFGYSRTIVELIRGIVTGDHSIHYAVVRNGTTLKDLPEDSFVEVPVFAMQNEIKNMQIEQLPTEVKGITISMQLYEQKLIEAAMHRDKIGLRNAMIMHPLIIDWRLAQPLFEDILEENSQFIPELK